MFASARYCGKMTRFALCFRDSSRESSGKRFVIFNFHRLVIQNCKPDELEMNYGAAQYSLKMMKSANF